MASDCPPRDIATEERTAPRLVLITGMSGAGRSESMHTFEDLGYFCIDNLPPSFLPQLVALAQIPGARLEKLAVVSDVRAHEFFAELLGELDRLRSDGIDFRVLYLEADDDTLLRRFKETRRRHPLCAEGEPLADGIAAERAALEPVRARADIVIDTSDVKPQELRRVILDRFGETASDALSIAVSSFGFKYGMPVDADLVMDVRFLPNPHYDPALRPLTGLDAPVRDYVLAQPETEEFLKRWFALLDTVVPGYVKEGKHHLSIALGCTGGMHRSVALAEKTAQHLRESGYRVGVSHRDMGRDLEPR